MTLSTMKLSTLRGLILAIALLPAASCSTSEILDVTDPDIVDPAVVSTPAGARALYSGALGEFIVAIVGDNGGIEGQILVSGSLTDELVNSETFPTRREYDIRAIDTRNGTLTTVFRNLQRSRYLLEAAAASLQQYSPTPAYQVAESFALAGMSYVFAGENYCSGVPFSTPFPAPSVYGSPLTTAEIFTRSIERFDAALALLDGVDLVTTNPDTVAIRRLNLARVGKARALLNRGDPGDYAAAADAVAAVPEDFVYNLTHTDNSNRQRNGIFAFTAQNERFSVADVDGGTGLNFRGANDPRVLFRRTFTINARGDTVRNVGFDNSTPQFDPLKYPSRTAPTPLATGIEARLIVAENILSTGGTAWLDTLNALRARRITPAMTPLVDPGTPAGRVDLVFRERAFWNYLTGHRLGDLRRLMRQYGRAEDAIFPTGAYFKGGTFGDDVNFPVPFDEINNPNFTECFDRNP
jgi:hypothetical protein